MKTQFHKKFLLNQTTEKLDSKLELFVLEEMLLKLEKDENYELASVVHSRMESIKKDEK